MRGKIVIVIMLLLLMPTILNKPVLAVEQGPELQNPPLVHPQIMKIIYVAYPDSGHPNPMAFWANKDLNYTWTVDSTTYQFHMDRTKIDLLMNPQALNHYHVYFQDGVQAEREVCARYGDWNFNEDMDSLVGYDTILINPHLIMKNLRDFVQQGHGYIGQCSGAAFAAPERYRPETWLAGFMNRSKFLNDNARAIYYAGFPIVDEHIHYLVPLPKY